MGNALSHIKWKDILLPVLAVMVVGMIIFPLPSWILDVLLAANLAFCVILLLSSLYVSEPDRFTSLPSLLLLSTLFRLGLNISSTRIILSGVSVPDVIIAFGNFVVAGSTIVGLVVFSIISIIQFIVIAKGSERVAEVAARFTLDALPGKQMSIDADMRAGLLNMSEAREKRRELHRESKLYGALDGAMKFIKGDAIVGLCIIFINIIAGFIVGVTRDGLPFQDAVAQYTLFTIGDGLVSQIPAVLVSVAAGIVVTRVSENEGGVLSHEISTQLVKEPLVLLISGIVLVMLSFVPGLPFLPFMGVSMIPLLTWISSIKKNKRENVKKETGFQFTPKVLPSLVIKLSQEGAFTLQKEQNISGYIEAIRADIFDQHGVYLPEVCFDIEPQQHGVIAELLIHAQSKGMVTFTQNNEELQKETDPWSRTVGNLLRTKLAICLTEFVDDAHTRTLLDLYEPYNLDLINSLIPEKINVTFLTLVLRVLVEEEISIRDFVCILQALSEDFHENSYTDMSIESRKNVSYAVRVVRKKLVPKSIIQSHSKEDPLDVYIFNSELEEMLVRQAEADIRIHPDISDSLRISIKEKIKNTNLAKKIIILVHGSIHSSLFVSLRSLKNQIRLLSYEEVPPEIEVNILDTISINQNKEYYESAA